MLGSALRSAHPPPAPERLCRPTWCSRAAPAPSGPGLSSHRPFPVTTNCLLWAKDTCRVGVCRPWGPIPSLPSHAASDILTCEMCATLGGADEVMRVSAQPGPQRAASPREWQLFSLSLRLFPFSGGPTTEPPSICLEIIIFFLFFLFGCVGSSLPLTGFL